jgi:hypothetical protein
VPIRPVTSVQPSVIFRERGEAKMRFAEFEGAPRE